MRRNLVAVLALILAGNSCGDSTGPGSKPLQVTLQVEPPQTTLISDVPNEGPEIRCTFGLSAHATGDGTAEWQGARTFWYAGPDRTIAVDTTGNDPGDLYDTFGGRTIAGGETRHGQWTVAASVPFEATLEVDYAIGAAPSSHASVHFVCGPTPQSTVAPVVTSVTVTPPNGDLVTGDTLSVSYHETGASGVWMTIIDANGAFTAEQVVGEHLANTVDRTVKFVVPVASHMGVPLTISVTAYDAALHASPKSLETPLKFVDRTPPTMLGASLGGSFIPPNPPNATGLFGQFAVGDTMKLTAIATDNNALAWLVYSLGAPANARDSIPAAKDATYQAWDTWKIVVPPSWAGRPAMSVYARDAAGLTSTPALSPANGLSFYPVVTLPTTAPLQLTAYDSPTDVTYDAKRDRVYVGVLGSNQIVVFSPGTMTLGTPITLPAPPKQMDLSVSGDSLLVALPSQNTVAVVDLTNPAKAPTTIPYTASGTSSATWPFPPSHLRVAANGKMLVMPEYISHGLDDVVEVDLTTGAQRVRTDAHHLYASYDWFGDMGRTVDRSRIYMLGSCSSHYDVASDSFSPCGPNLPATGASSLPMSFDAAGDRIAYGDFVLDADVNMLWAPTGTTNVPPPAILSLDGTMEYLGVGTGLTMARIADHTLIERVPLPIGAGRMLMAPSGRWVLVFGALPGISAAGTRVTRVDLP